MNRCQIGLLIVLILIGRNVKADQQSKEPGPQCIDLNDQLDRQVIVDREAGQYLGHPTTCLLEDGKTMLCVYPKGHGRGAIVYKRSTDGGLTWSERLPTPASWATSQEVPTLHRVIDREGRRNESSCGPDSIPARLAVTEDDGATWSELEAGRRLGRHRRDGICRSAARPARATTWRCSTTTAGSSPKTAKPAGRSFKLYKTFSKDGGLTWSFPEVVYQASDVHLCEPGCIRSPDGKRLAVLLRENARRKNSHVIFSDDEGQTWTEPREVPLALTGDRHTGKYGPDGRLFISFRCRSPQDRAADRPVRRRLGRLGRHVGRHRQRPRRPVLCPAEGQHEGLTTRPIPASRFCRTARSSRPPTDTGTRAKQPYILSVRLKLEELDAMATEN